MIATETLHYLIYGVLGVTIHYLKEWGIASKASQTYDIKKVLPMVLLSVLTMIALITTREDFDDIYPIKSHLNAMIVGYMGNSLFFSIMNVKKPKGVSSESVPSTSDSLPKT